MVQPTWFGKPWAAKYGVPSSSVSSLTMSTHCSATVCQVLWRHSFSGRKRCEQCTMDA